MAHDELLLAGWQALSAAQKRRVFAQLTRYFVSPLLRLDRIEPVTVRYYGQALTTFDVLLAGEWLRFVPGQARVTLGVAAPLPPEQAALVAALGLAAPQVARQLSPQRVVAMPPMLVARQAVPVDEEVIGQIDLTTQVFVGNHFAYVPVKPTVLHLLAPVVRALDPAASPSWPPRLAARHVVLRLAGPQQYQVAIQRATTPAALARRLGAFGFQLPSEDQYEYLHGGGLTPLLPWGNRVPATLPAYVPNRFGLTVHTHPRANEWLTTPVDKTVAAASGAADWLAWSPFFRAPQTAFGLHVYRKVAAIALA